MILIARRKKRASYNSNRNRMKRKADNLQQTNNDSRNETVKRNWDSYAKANVDINAGLSSRSTGAQSTIISLRNMLRTPANNSVQIGAQLEALYNTNGSVARIINYFTSLLTYNYNIYPKLNPKSDFNISYDLKEYLTVANHIELYNLKQYAPYFIRQALIHGVGFFYEVTSNSGTVYIEFPASMCRVAYIEDGVYRFMIDVDSISDDLIELPGFPTELINAKETGPQENNAKWNGNYYIVGNKGFAITLDGSIIRNGGLAVSPFASLILDALEVTKAKENINIKDDIDAVRIIHAKIPTDDKTGDIMMDSDTAGEWQNVMTGGLPEGVAPIVTPFDVDNIPLTGAGNQGAYATVSDAQEQLYKSIGVPSSMFGDKTTSSNIVKISIQKDAAYIASLAIPVLTSYYNSVLKRVKTDSDSTWNIRILEQDRFFANDYSKLLKDAVTLGDSRLDYLASLGKNPLEIYTKLTLEQQILNIDNIMVPKATSFTMSSGGSQGGDVGRPTTDNPTDDTDRINDAQ